LIAYILVLRDVSRLVLSLLGVPLSHDTITIAGMILMVLGLIVLFLAPLVLAERYAKRWACRCPECSADVMQRGHAILATRCCPACGARVVEGGRTHDIAVFRRAKRIVGRRVLVWSLWFLPAMAAGVILIDWVFPSVSDETGLLVSVYSLTGLLATGWTFARTRDWRSIPPLVASLALLAVGARLFWLR
jgi:hypothetical protein